jgi:hypothetical protein
LGTVDRLEKEATSIQDEILKAENQRKPPETVGAVEVGGPPKTDPTAIETQPNPDVYEKCKSRTDLVGELEEYHLRLASATKELVQVYRAKRKFTKAVVSYEQLSKLAKKEIETHKLAKAEDKAKKSEEEYLTCQYELAEMFRELKRNKDRLEIAKKAYQRRASHNRFGEEAKKSHFQYCSFLLTNDFHASKKEHRDMYKELDDSGEDPARMIENGYQLVDVLEHQEGPENARFKCWKVFEKAQEIPDLEIKLLIKIAEEVVALEESLNQPYEKRIDEALKTVWGAVCKARTESHSSKLSDNHLALCEKHGSRLLEAAKRAEKAEYYEKAAQVLEVVWTDRKSHQSGLEERKASTLATAERLFICYFDYGRFEDAARVGQWIVDVRK